MNHPDADRSTQHPLLRFLRRLAGGGEAPLTGDADLLRRFVQEGDRPAFELLLWRHGPMVLQVCRAVLHDAHDAEDAFQAAFLVLARKAASIGRREAVGAWLYRVARRIAVKLHQQRRRRGSHEQQGLDLTAVGDAVPTTDPAAAGEVQRLLHAEVERLPAKYRAPVVLCYLEGRTNEEAAAQLGWSKGTVSGRLARARDLLRRRLERVGLPAAGLSLTLLAADASATLPAALVGPTLQAAVTAAAGGSLAGFVSPRVVSLVEGALTTMATIKFKLLAGLLLFGVGAGAVAYSGTGGAAPGGRETTPQAEKGVAAPQTKPRLYRVASPLDGIVVAVGTELKKPNEPAPAGARKIEVKIGNDTRAFWVLREGDQVEAGQVLLQLDDRLARNTLLLKKTRLAAAKADLAAAATVTKEAEARLARMEALKAQRAVSEEEYRAAALTRDRYVQEEISKREAVNLAALEVQQAEMLVDMHAVRSAVRGTIRAIHKTPGEGVRALETLIEIEPSEKK
jgi:RNA polymerase sigma factor (sigma-70 family)